MSWTSAPQVNRSQRKSGLWDKSFRYKTCWKFAVLSLCMLSWGEGKNNTDIINHATERVETCFVIAWSPFLNFYLTSCGDFLFQVERGFLLLRTSEAFHMPEPRCHLENRRESQDLSVNEWEEMAEAFTQRTSRWIITHVLHFRVKYQGSVFSACIWFASNI